MRFCALTHIAIGVIAAAAIVVLAKAVIHATAARSVEVFLGAAVLVGTTLTRNAVTTVGPIWAAKSRFNGGAVHVVHHTSRSVRIAIASRKATLRDSRRLFFGATAAAYITTSLDALVAAGGDQEENREGLEEDHCACFLLGIVALGSMAAEPSTLLAMETAVLWLFGRFLARSGTAWHSWVVMGLMCACLRYDLLCMHKKLRLSVFQLSIGIGIPKSNLSHPSCLLVLHMHLASVS